ncbi:MAG: protein kinase [Candidatus Aminicenantes bacterium]|nr:protein kinase [Candidatus Aminicenantes bacterium]
MKCLNCHTENPVDMSICSNCGAQLLENITMKTLNLPDDDSPSFRTKTLQTPVDELLGKSLFAGRYMVEREIGRGGMGVVYKAKDTKLNRTVALKFLPQELVQDPQAKERFILEAQAAAALDHPNICTVYEVDEAEGKTFISMAYVEGQSLKKKIKEDPPKLSEALNISIQVAEGLNEAHKKGIVHRDIKSANIMLGEKNRAQIMDFGLAKISGAKGVTKTGTTMGTIGYMSPEQAKGKETDLRTDIFSFGAVFYELITGQLPFNGDSEASVLHSLLYDEPEPLKTYIEDIPEEWQWVVEKALCKDRDTRYKNTDEILFDLNCLKALLVGEEGITAIQRIKRNKISALTSIPTKAWRRASWAQRLGFGFVLVTLVVASVIFWPFAGGLVPTAEGSSLVVIPYQEFGDVETGLNDAVTSSLNMLLSGVEGVETIVPPRSFELEKVEGDWARMGEIFGAKRCVLSTLSVTLERLELNVQLVDTRTKKVLWSHMYEGRPINYMQPVREAARGILQKIFPESSPELSEKNIAATDEAEKAFQLGLRFSEQYNNYHFPEDFDRAFAEFQKALELDPGLANAGAEIAMLYEFKFEASTSWRETLPELQKWTQRALKIDPLCSRAWTAMGMAEFQKPLGNRKKQLEYSLKAASLDPTDPFAHLGIGIGTDYYSLFLSYEAILTSYRLDPFYLYPAIHLSALAVIQDRNLEALEFAERALLIKPEMPKALWQKFGVLTKLNRSKEADQFFEQLKKSMSEGRFPQEYFLFAQLWKDFNSRDTQIVDSALEGLLLLIDNPKENPRAARTAIELSVKFITPFLMKRGKTEEALHILDKGLKASLIPYDFLSLTPEFKSLRGDPRFEEFLAKTRKRFDEMLVIFNEARARGEFPEYLEKPLADLLDKLDIENNKEER